MSVQFRYQPPAVNAAALLSAAAPLAAHAGAEALLAASLPNVPVESGALKASGRVEQDGLEAYVTFGRDGDGERPDESTNDYVLVQHESLTNHHPNGGSAKWLERAMQSDGPGIATAMAVTLSKAIGG